MDIRGFAPLYLFNYKLIEFLPSTFAIRASTFQCISNLTQKFQTARLFTQMIAYKFFQKFRAFFERGLRKLNPSRFGQVTAFNPQKLLNRPFAKQCAGCGAGSAVFAYNPAPL